MADKSGSTRRPRRNTHVTKSGKTIKVNRSIGQRWKQRKDNKLQRKAVRKADLPQNPVKRMLYHLQPKRMYHYWFSRDGGIMALKILGIGMAVGFLLLVGLFAYFRKDLPNLRDPSGSSIGGSIRYYDRTGKTLLWEDYDAVKRVPVEDKDISPYIKEATVAIEDKDFFKHGGFDVRGIIRAGVNNAVGSSGNTQGGSTITQQLVKLTQDWTKDRTYTRKVKELILSVELERSYSKQEILTGYLNTAPYGGIEVGVETAARDYFNKSAKDLTLAEAAMLATIPKSPRYYSPYSDDFDKEAFAGRKNYVLDLMEQQGMITKKERDEAQKVDVVASVKPRKPKYDGITAPWFVLTAKKQLENEVGSDNVKRGGWTVTTTLDLDKQRLAEEQVKKGLAQVIRQGGDTAAFAAEDVTTGQIVALVGGSDFTNKEFGEFNYATSPLPPGSSFKPYDYTALIENSSNIGAGSVLFDTQGAIEGYPCTNKQRPKQGGNCLWDYDFRYPGPVTLRYALGGSRNVPAVKAMLTAGIDKTIDTAEKLGLKSGYKCYQDEQFTKESACYASSAIGDGAYLHLDEHVHAYASLSRNGLNIPQTYILKVVNAGGKTLDEWKPSKGEQAVRQDSAYIVADMMSDPNASYFPSGRKPHRYQGWKFAMKTGTTNDGKDGWMMGFSTKYAAGVWVGYHTRQKVMSGTMENMTQPIWQGWMDAAHNGLKPVDRVKPSGVKTEAAYVIRSHIGVGSIEPSPSTDLYPSWYKANSKSTSGPRTIDKVSGKLATECTPARAKETTNDAAANQFSGDRFVTGAGGSSSDKDDVHKCSDVKPSISLNSTQSGGSYQLSVDVTQGTHPITSDKFKGTVNYIVDGQTVRSFNIDGPGVGLASFTYTPSGTQSVTAQIIDSVLYDGSSEAMNLAGSGGSISLNQSSTSGNTTTFTWSGGSGTVRLYNASTNASIGCSGSGGSCSKNNLTIGITVYAKDDNGAVSNQITVSGNP